MLKLLEKIFTVAMLVYTTSAIMPLLLAGNYPFPGIFGDRFAFVVQTAFYAGLFCLIAVRWQSFLRSAWNGKWAVALLAVAFLSAAWAEDPLFTLRRAIVLCGTTAFGIYLGSRFEVQEQLQLLAWTFGIVICASFLCVLFLPQYGIDHLYHYGDWQGVFSQKNSLARAMVLATLVFLFVRFRSGNTLRWIGIAGSLTLLVLSRSVTGVVVFAIIFASWPLYRLLRTKFTFAVPVAATIFTVVAAGAAVAYQALPALLEALNRDESLTGRIDLWQAVWLSISRKPWLGYGFDAFWKGMQGESALVLQTVGWAPGYAHNGFLDLVLDLGFIGLVVFACGYLVLWRRAITFVIRDPRPTTVWPCMYLVFMLFYNLTEGPVISQNNITWVLYVATAVSLAIYLPVRHTAANEVPS
jgi:exopolysaccharide production protein ExoQ